VKDLSEHACWVAEPKYNGSRLQLHVIDGKPEFWDRHGKELTYKPNDEIKKAIQTIFPQKGYYLFDGELRHNKVKGIQHKIVLWDCFIYDSKLVKMPYWARRNLLAMKMSMDLLLELNSISIIRQYPNNFLKLFDELIEKDEEFEGIVIKNLHGKLDISRTSASKSRWMFKVRKQTGRHRF
jgi:ATP-dependent DNA ligase